MVTLITKEQLNKSKNILFIVHLAIGDYAYLQNGLFAFHQKYPHLLIDLFIDEGRRTPDPSKWEGLSHYILYDWVRSCGFINKAYDKTFSPQGYQNSIAEAKACQYSIVCALTTLSQHHYAQLALEISQNKSITIATKKRTSFFKFKRREIYKRLTGTIPIFIPKNNYHISDVYAYWFRVLADINLTKKERYPFINIPEKWDKKATEIVINQTKSFNEKIFNIFINSFSKEDKRSWPLDNVFILIEKMRATHLGGNSFFWINSMPDNKKTIEEIITKKKLKNIAVFTAIENFFELPAILSKMDLIISVETAIIHLANTVKVPVIALMRLKNPEWIPIDTDNSLVLFTDKKQQYIYHIKPKKVLEALENFIKRET